MNLNPNPKKDRLGRRLAAFVVAIALLSIPAGAAQGLPTAIFPREGGRVLVWTLNMQAQDAVARTMDGPDSSLLHEYERFPLLLFDATEKGRFLLEHHPLVVSVSPDVAMPPALASTLPIIQADEVHDVGYDGTGLAVAILDTGVDRDHPFLAGRIVSEACYSNAGGDGTGTSLCPNEEDEQVGAGSADVEIPACLNGMTNICDHGSHVAGIASGAATGVTGAPGDGVAPGADIVMIQVFTRINTDSECGASGPAPCVLAYVSDQILGLERVLEIQEDDLITPDIVAVNMSLGGGNNGSACDGDGRKAAIDDLLGANIATVISAGNDGHPAAVGAPGCISSAITVGATDDLDNIAGFSNRGSLVDIWAPGVAVDSSVPDDAWANFDGTSMAAPHVTGAWALMRDVYPSASVATIQGWLQANGVDINYVSGSNSLTQPRLDVLAALQPIVSIDDLLVQVSEGTTATNAGAFSDPNGAEDTLSISASVGDIVDNGDGTWSWSFDALDGPADTQTVTITASDDKGFSAAETFELTVNNVVPQLALDPAQVTAILEGQSLSVQVDFTDPGVFDDPYVASVDWGHADLGVDAASVAMSHDGAGVGDPDAGSLSATKVVGDRGLFTVTVTVTDKDGGIGTASFDIDTHEVNPDGSIDLSGATVINGQPTIVGEAGTPVDLSAQANDPGSDDLLFDWAFGDGNTALGAHLVNAPAADPFPSPQDKPRVNVEDQQSNLYEDACLYTLELVISDDDAATADLLSVPVLIQGNSDRGRPMGWWLSQYQNDGNHSVFATKTLECYLAMARFGSTVFDEEFALSSIEDADGVFMVGGDGAQSNPRNLLIREVLTAWLNFADGVYLYETLVLDTDGDRILDQSFADAILGAEQLIMEPQASQQQLAAAHQDLIEVNLFRDA